MRLSSPLRRTSGHSGSGAATSRPNRAFVWTIEAARLLAGDGDAAALRLLKMAVKEIGQTMAARKGVIDLIDEMHVPENGCRLADRASSPSREAM
jgi:hypothetical protein